MKLSEKIQEALREQQEINLSDPAVQKRLAAQWGYVPAGAQPAPSVPDGVIERLAALPARITPEQAPDGVRDYCHESAEGYADGWNACMRAIKEKTK